MNAELAQVPPSRKTGQEQFHFEGKPAGFDLKNFWQWSNSDLLDTAARGALAEYIVARALGISTSGVRDCWTAWDLTTPSGLKIQVKSCAYIQSWHQKSLTPVKFSVKKRTAWDPKTGHYEPDPKRRAHVYVFALLAHQDKNTIDPLNLQQWKFFVVPTALLDEKYPNHNSITLCSLEALVGPGVGFADLVAELRRVCLKHKLLPAV